MPDTFICAECGGTFEKGWTDEEAAAECQERFPGNQLDQCAVVCDECYQRIIASSSAIAILLQGFAIEEKE